ncbi:MAG: AtpZ/AtpI family protein [SAR324 cluster bacterium]|nr:AtpZ/AtpI family protein [SAR324 cluster bacterium]MCH8886670.1 AtpZ/AtpI family protein [SAR324 cluster bacterium]
MAPPTENPWRRLLQFSTIGLEMGLSVVLGLLIGNYLDRWLNTAPWMLVLFLMLGFAAGFRRLFSLARQYQKEISKDNNDE